MTALIVILAGGTMLLLAVAMAWVLGWANKTFHVEVNPLVDQAIDILPGANCGGCGYVGCAEYAEAVVAGKAAPNLCSVGGESCSQALAALLGIEVSEALPYRPVVHCAADYDDRLKRAEYTGEPTCGAANLIAGVQGCTYGCLGFGDCQQACPFDAIHVVNGLATVDYDKCVGCGACAKVCPRNIISMVPFKAERILACACSNHDPGKVTRQVCKVGCIGCGLCRKLNDLFNVTDNLAGIDYDRYDPEMDFQPVLAKCPRNGLLYVGKPSPQDLAAVADEELPERVEADFKTTVDKTEFRG